MQGEKTLTSGFWLGSTLTYTSGSNTTKRSNHRLGPKLSSINIKEHFTNSTRNSMQIWTERQTTQKKARLPFCSQNEKRDLYAMVTGQKSWNKLGDVENKCMDWWENRKRDSREEENVLCGVMKNGNLGVSGGVLWTGFLNTTGHTATGQWDHAALRTEDKNNIMKWIACFLHTTRAMWKTISQALHTPHRAHTVHCYLLHAGLIHNQLL